MGAEADHSQPRLPPGHIVGGKFTVGKRIGFGGMAEVYEAVADLSRVRDVALKVMHPEIAQLPVALARLKNEVATLQKIEHPNVVQVVDFGSDGDLYYLAMRLLRGESLADQLDDGRWPSMRRSVEVVLDVLDGLAAAHAEGLIHRDLKPDNVFMREEADGAVVPTIIDWGIVRNPHRERHTAVGTGMGTSAYSSPEQATAAHSVEGPADVYSIGAMLYELLTGRRPFQDKEGDELAVVTAKLERDYPALTNLNPAIPPALVQLIEDCLAPEPDQRPADATALRERLIEVRETEPLTDNPPAPPSTSASAWDGAVSAPVLAPSALGHEGTGQRASPPSPVDSQPPAPPKRSLWPGFAVALLLLTGVGVGVVFLGPEPSSHDGRATESHRPDHRELATTASAGPGDDDEARSRSDGAHPQAAVTPRGEGGEDPSSAPHPETGPVDEGTSTAPTAMEERTETAPAAGTLRVIASPSGEIFIDGRRVGRDAVTQRLPPGAYTVRATRAGITRTRRVTIRAGRSSRITVPTL